MGRWTLDELEVTAAERSSAEVYGHDVRATFRLRYARSLVGHFVETPEVVWHEHIIMKEQRGDQRTYWHHECDQYQRNPGSMTFDSWKKRYGGNAIFRGNAVLLDRRATVTRPPPRGEATPASQARAGRRFLKHHSGILQIEVHDVPSLGRAGDWTLKERYIFFTFGVQGGALWRRARQWLLIDRTEGEMRQRSFDIQPLERGDTRPAWAEVVDTDGYTEVEAPDHVSGQRGLLLVAGEYR